jgi:hypothetical protein
VGEVGDELSARIAAVEVRVERDELGRSEGSAHKRVEHAVIGALSAHGRHLEE